MTRTPISRRRAALLLLPLFAVAGYWLWPEAVTPTATIDDTEYAALRAALPVRPGEERYTTVPWELSLAAGRAKATAERKPMLIWTMDGHPLGCG